MTDTPTRDETMIDTATLRGRATQADGRRVQLNAEECQRLLAQVEADKQRRAETMPDEKAALQAMFEAYQRLKELGWREAIYCPKDGTSFDVIEAGSTGIHRAHYYGKWPDGGWMTEGEGDLWPSRPILFRPDPKAEAERQKKMAAAVARFRAEKEAGND